MTVIDGRSHSEPYLISLKYLCIINELSVFIEKCIIMGISSCRELNLQFWHQAGLLHCGTPCFTDFYCKSQLTFEFAVTLSRVILFMTVNCCICLTIKCGKTLAGKKTAEKVGVKT